MRRRALLSSAAAGATAALSGCLDDLLGDRVQETRERTFDISEGTPLRVATRNGDVDAAISPDVDATVTASTENGDVAVDGLGFGGSDGDQSGDGQRRVSGTLGDGTHEVSVTTRNGDVELRALE